MHVVAHPDERPAEVLDVDVAPRAGEHLAVGDEEVHGGQSLPEAVAEARTCQGDS